MYTIPVMDILSEETRRLLQDETVRKTVREVLEDAASNGSKTVTVQKSDKHESTQVTVRRLSA